MKKWIALFSQTGSEIFNLSKTLNRVPDRIITNNPHLENVNQNILQEYYDKLWLVGPKPTAEEYNTMFCKDSIITMHGWLRVIPPSICEEYKIINLHPAPLSEYPHLKGKDPQKRIYKERLAYYGNTIHECTAELDSGKILAEEKFFLPNSYTEEDVFNLTHQAAFKLWKNFLQNTL